MALASGDDPIIDEEAGALNPAEPFMAEETPMAVDSSDALPALIRKPPKPFQNTEVGALITEEQFKWLIEARDTLIGAFQNQDHSNGLCNTAYMLYHLRLRRNGRQKRMTYINAGLFDHMFHVSREQNIHRGGRVNTTEELFHSLKIFNPEIRIDLLQAICTKDDVEDLVSGQLSTCPSLRASFRRGGLASYLLKVLAIAKMAKTPCARAAPHIQQYCTMLDVSGNLERDLLNPHVGLASINQKFNFDHGTHNVAKTDRNVRPCRFLHRCDARFLFCNDSSRFALVCAHCDSA